MRTNAPKIDEVVGILTGNLEKIAEHGRRADGIVTSMLSSRFDWCFYPPETDARRSANDANGARL